MYEKMPRTPFSTPLSGSAKETELRLKNIFSGPKKRPPVLFLVLMFSVCIFCGNLVSCQVKEAENNSPSSGASQSGDVSLEGDPLISDDTYQSARQAVAQEKQTLLENLLQAAERESGYRFQTPSAQLLTTVDAQDCILGAVFVEDHLENTLILGVMERETGEIPQGVFQCSVKNGWPNIVTVYVDEKPCLLYTFNGQENGQYTGQAGLVCLEGKDLTWKWPAEGDVREPESPAGQKYRDFWTGHLALMAPGGVDVYAVNPDFQWGKDEPWSMWQLENGETFWSSSSSAEELPMPIYFQSLSWLVAYTNDPGGWRVLSLKPNRELSDPETRTDCFTLEACTDNGAGAFTADLFFNYDPEPSRPRSYSELVHAEVRAPLPSAAVPDPEARAAYVRVLEDLLYRSILPDGGEAIFEDMSENTFALADVDGDGREELVLLTRPDIYAGYRGYILDYYKNALVIQHEGFPSFTFYSNGAFTEDDSHAQGVWTDTFWPHSLYIYQPASDRYELAGHVSAWEKSVSDINVGNLPPFPTEEDKSGAGILYYIHPLSSYEHLNTLDSRVNMAVDQSVYLAWLEPVLGNARPLELEYLPLTAENIEQIK